MEPLLTVKSKHLVTKVQSLGPKKLSVVDNSGVVRIFNKVQAQDESWQLENHSSIRIPVINDTSTSTSISTSRDGTLLAAHDQSSKSIKVFNIIQKKMIFKIEWHQGGVEHVLFDDENKYLATGGNDGKVCIWSCITGKLLYTLPHHTDFISSLEFSSANKKFASGSYDTVVHIFDLRKMETIATLKSKHKVAIVSISFFAVSSVLTIDKSGNILAWNYKTSSVLYILPKTKSEPIYSTVIEDSYLIVACKDSYVYLYSLKDRKLLNMRYIYSKERIGSASFDSKNLLLFVSTLNSSIHCYDLLYGKDDIKTYIRSADYLAAYSLLVKNPLLEDLEPHVKVLSERWDDAVKDAIGYLEQEEKDRAKRSLAPFMDIPSKAELAQGILSEYKDFTQFRDAVDKSNFQLANTLLIKHPLYKQSDYYGRIQDEWDKCVAKVTLALESNTKDIDKDIDKIFKNFRGISEKLVFIREVSSKKIALSLFNKYFDQENYKECFNIVKNNEFLKEIEAYRNLLIKEDALYKQLKNSLDRELYLKCKEYALQLLAFPKHQREAGDILNNIDKIDNLINFYTNKDYRSMLSLIEKYPFLGGIIQVSYFHDEFEAAMETAETHAAKGNIANILKVFEPYIQVKQLHERMGKIISSTYIQQMHFLIKKFPDKTSVIVNGLNNYVDIFGIDDAVLGYVAFIKEHLGLDLLQGEEDTTTSKANYERWVKTNLPARIF